MEIASLPVEIQLLLVSGYLGYRVFVTGRGVAHDATDTALQIVTFGSIGRLFAAIVTLSIPHFSSSLSSASELILVAVLTAAFAVTAAAIWRRWGLKAASDIMRKTRIYRDDHQYSAWASIMTVETQWNYIQLQLTDGRTIESNFSQLQMEPPGDRLTVNEDGFALYITAIYDKDDIKRDLSPAYGSDSLTISYIPRSTVSQVDIGWQSLSQ